MILKEYISSSVGLGVLIFVSSPRLTYSRERSIVWKGLKVDYFFILDLPGGKNESKKSYSTTDCIAIYYFYYCYIFCRDLCKMVSCTADDTGDVPDVYRLFLPATCYMDEES